MLTERKPYYYLFGLLVFAGIFLITGIGDVALIDWDENIYAEASRQMLVRNNYLNVFINDFPFTEKPPLFFWEQVISYRIFGVNEFAARFPSCVAGILMIGLFYFIGRKIGSYSLGLIWGAVYLTSLLPSMFARAAVIDHTFNFFIAASTFFLYLFDVEFGHYITRKQRNPKSFGSAGIHMRYLTAAAVCMGLSVLTKGPVGGVIPLVGFAGYKWFNRFPAIKIHHFFFCAIISLSIGFSWYTLNWITYGGKFIEGFAGFMIALFSKPLEGHEGPFFYHFGVVLLGLLPWTPFLFSAKRKQVFKNNVHIKPIFQLGFTWVLFVLVLFSFVSTKLPHYSASVYIPLTFIIAANLHHYLIEMGKVSVWISVFYTIAGCSLAILLMLLPRLIMEYTKREQFDFTWNWSYGLYIMGVILIGLFLLAAVLFHKNSIILAVLTTIFSMFLFTQTLWHYHLPPFLQINQNPLVEMVHDSHQKQGRVVLYRMVSFAAFFYGSQPIDILHNYKFPGNPDILDHRQNKDLYIITDPKNKERLLEEHPMVKFVKNNGRFSLFILPKKE